MPDMILGEVLHFTLMCVGVVDLFPSEDLLLLRDGGAYAPPVRLGTPWGKYWEASGLRSGNVGKLNVVCDGW